MITEDYVSFETAKLLKEKGFDWHCFRFYDADVNRVIMPYCSMLDNELQCLTNSQIDKFYQDKDICRTYTAPTLQMAMKWLREVYNIDISVTPDRKAGYSVLIFKDKRLPFDTLDSYSIYEQACETAIKYCLENLI